MVRDPEGVESKVILDLIGSKVGKALEVGCGNGRLTGRLARSSDFFLGLDSDYCSMEQARPLHENGVRLALGSGEILPFPGGVFDIVIFSYSLHHQDPARALGEARRVLKEEGRILVLEPVARSLVTMLFALLKDESGEYKRAETAIHTSGLRELRSGSFSSLWVFEDFRELTGYLFDYYDLDPDPIRVRNIEELLGKRQGSEPLELEDITRYWLLYEGSDRSCTCDP